MCICLAQSLLFFFVWMYVHTVYSLNILSINLSDVKAKVNTTRHKGIQGQLVDIMLFKLIFMSRKNGPPTKGRNIFLIFLGFSTELINERLTEIFKDI